MRTTVHRLRRAARWAVACCAVALAAACQTPPPAPPPQGGLSPQQKQVLRDEGFRETDEGWTLEMPGRFLFETDSDALAPSLRDKVERMGKALQGVGIHRLRVEGHSDRSGTAPYNGQLSLRRARAVADLLIGAGMPADSVQAQGFGSSRPLVQSDAPEDCKENRRVAIVVPVQ